MKYPPRIKTDEPHIMPHEMFRVAWGSTGASYECFQEIEAMTEKDQIDADV